MTEEEHRHRLAKPVRHQLGDKTETELAVHLQQTGIHYLRDLIYRHVEDLHHKQGAEAVGTWIHTSRPTLPPTQATDHRHVTMNTIADAEEAVSTPIETQIDLPTVTKMLLLGNADHIAILMLHRDTILTETEIEIADTGTRDAREVAVHSGSATETTMPGGKGYRIENETFIGGERHPCAACVWCNTACQFDHGSMVVD